MSISSRCQLDADGTISPLHRNTQLTLSPWIATCFSLAARRRWSLAKLGTYYSRVSSSYTPTPPFFRLPYIVVALISTIRHNNLVRHIRIIQSVRAHFYTQVSSAPPPAQ